jgi:Skp family chaperone for outer membrane proteins
MKSHLVAALAALAVGSAAAVTSISQDKDKPAPTRVGFIDMNKAYDTYSKRKDLMEGLQAKGNAMQAELKRRANEIEEEAGKLNTLNPGTPEYADRARKIEIAKYSLDLDRKMMLSELKDEQNKKIGGVYKEISQEAETYMAEHGFAAVVLYLPPDFEFGLNNIDLFSGTRAVLSRDAQLDITKEVIDRLNAQLPEKK